MSKKRQREKFSFSFLNSPSKEAKEAFFTVLYQVAIENLSKEQIKNRQTGRRIK